MNLDPFIGFALQRGATAPEENIISTFAFGKDIPCIRVGVSAENEHLNYVPVGSVEFCESFLGMSPKPNYYPDFCFDHLYRKVWRSDKWELIKAFCKPADRHKRFNGFVTFGTYKKKKKPPLWYSDIVKFKDEFRYYISNGLVVAADWYWNEDEPFGEIVIPPPLDIKIPSGWCGTVDMGYLDTGEFALIECHPPYACGWYGGSYNASVLAQWLVDGWRYMMNNKGV